MTVYSCPYLCEIFTGFQNSFTSWFGSKFAIETRLKIPPHLKHVAALHCETLVFKM